ncbi:MAG TPA: hydroxysqualene dehydroxylase HpnE [Blastocatellia bacterium]|nr:hydroxysqualene dehydroxylase HpnE [Blastocatellia bacterium]
MSSGINSPFPLSPSPLVLILGGGFAGLAAAVDLAEAGRRVLLLERRSFLGGRAYSFADKITGDTIDNGQHLMMGCYHRTLRFLEKIGSLDKIKFQPDPQVDFLQEEADGSVTRASFKCPPLPAPLHLLGGLARLKTIGWGDRLRALGVGLAVRQAARRAGGQAGGQAGGMLNGDSDRLAEITVREWLDSLGQSERIQRRFWRPMALATLNEAPDVASADMFARVIELGFMRAKSDSAMVISRVGLSDLYTRQAQSFIEDRGGEVRLNADVSRIDFEDNVAAGVTLRSGERIEADAVISAVPYFALKRMMPAEFAAAHFPCLDRLKSAPIVSINLWYDEPITDLEFAGLLDSPIEWVFNKNSINQDGSANGRQHLALVISAAHEAASKPKEELIALAEAEIKRFFPEARKLCPFHAFVVREHDATISHPVGTARLRPSSRTRFDNFFLAGDWTATGLPATIEGAVQSGQDCARMVLEGSGIADCGLRIADCGLIAD